MPVRQPDPAAIGRVAALLEAGDEVPRDELAEAARAITAELAARHPGHTIEVRLPPFAACQVGALGGEGPAHRRGTPPNVVEMTPATAIRLAAGQLTWAEALTSGQVQHSGAHAADVAAMLPLI